MLTPLGPAGVGKGPNLSGLFTSFYPSTAQGDRPWSQKLLAEWVANPRSLRRRSTMPPVALNARELQDVMEQMRAIPKVAAH